MGLKRGAPCHYCSEVADTLDHIVAKAWLTRLHEIPMKTHQMNKVPCCARCNRYKAHYRSDCECATCVRAWEVMAEFILPKVKREVPLILMAGALTIEPVLKQATTHPLAQRCEHGRLMLAYCGKCPKDETGYADEETG